MAHRLLFFLQPFPVCLDSQLFVELRYNIRIVATEVFNVANHILFCFCFLFLCQQKLFDRDGATSVEWRKDPSGWRRVSFPPVICPCFLSSTASTSDTWDEHDTHISYAVLREWPSVLFAPQGLYCEHGRSDSCLQTRVSAGYVVSNKQPLEPWWLSKKSSFMTHHNKSPDEQMCHSAAVRQVEAALLQSATCWHEDACA